MKTAFNSDKRIGIQAVRRALILLEALAEAEGGLALSDLSKQRRLNKSTAYQLLTTLHASGFVEKDPTTRRYRLGAKVLEIARSFLDSSDLIARSEALLREIRGRTGETATLNLLAGDHRITAARAESPHPLRLSASLGELAPLLRGAGGKAIAAFLPKELRKSLIAQAEKKGELGKGQARAVVKELRKVRARGYSVTLGEHVPGGFGIAVPLFDEAHQVIGSLGLSGPIERLTPSLRKEAIMLLHRASGQLSLARDHKVLATTQRRTDISKRTEVAYG